MWESKIIGPFGSTGELAATLNEYAQWELVSVFSHLSWLYAALKKPVEDSKQLVTEAPKTTRRTAKRTAKG